MPTIIYSGKDQPFYDAISRQTRPVRCVRYNNPFLPLIGECIWVRGPYEYEGADVLYSMQMIGARVNPAPYVAQAHEKALWYTKASEAGLPVPWFIVNPSISDLHGRRFPLVYRTSRQSNGKGMMLIDEFEKCAGVIAAMDVAHPDQIKMAVEFLRDANHGDDNGFHWYTRVYMIGGKVDMAIRYCQKLWIGYEKDEECSRLWREANTGGYQLGDEIAADCASLGKLLSLDIFAVDLMETAQGHRFVDVNPCYYWTNDDDVLYMRVQKTSTGHFERVVDYLYSLEA